MLTKFPLSSTPLYLTSSIQITPSLKYPLILPNTYLYSCLYLTPLWPSAFMFIFGPDDHLFHLGPVIRNSTIPWPYNDLPLALVFVPVGYYPKYQIPNNATLGPTPLFPLPPLYTPTLPRLCPSTSSPLNSLFFEINYVDASIHLIIIHVVHFLHLYPLPSSPSHHHHQHQKRVGTSSNLHL